MLKQTPIYPAHLALNAHMTEFAGYSMPLYYGVQSEEHLKVRSDVGMFDVSHMGVVDIFGPKAQDFLRILMANDVRKLKKPGKALYTCMLNTQGGILDDLIVYFIATNHYRLVVNAATKNKDLDWLKTNQNNFDIDIHQPKMGLIAVQGPNARTKISQIIPELNSSIQNLKPFEFFITKQNWLIAATGYTGEDGLEIILPEEMTLNFWQTLLKNNITPIGLGARDTLRLEAGLNLYGQDMDESTHPYESNLGWTVSLTDKDRDFIGRVALEKILISAEKQGFERKLIGLILQEKGILRHDQNVLKDNTHIGIITSGSFSPTLKVSIALARIKNSIENDCLVEIRGKLLKTVIVEPPFVRRKH